MATKLILFTNLLKKLQDTYLCLKMFITDFKSSKPGNFKSFLNT